MERSEIRHWVEKYDEAYDERLHTIEKDLHTKLTEQGYLTQDQLRKVVEWKLDNQPGRRNGNIERLNRVTDEFIRRVSEAALLLNNPLLQLKTLSSIPGIGGATATVILTFYDPTIYAVGDRYMVDVLLGEDRQMRMTDYPEILEELDNRNPGEFDLRTVEKAYYQRYRDTHGL